MSGVDPHRLASPRRLRGALLLALSVAAAGSEGGATASTPATASTRAPAATQSAPADARSRLRVCSDPNNMPFSNARGEGLENALARLIGREMHAAVEYAWMPQRRGFVRNTLQAGRCDLIMEVPVGFGPAATTEPYYRSTYVFVYRKDRKLVVHSLDDQALRGLRIGVQIIGDDYENSPPVAALARRGLVDQVIGYPVYGDYSQEVPLAPVVADVARGRIDVAIVWGPLAGWLAKRSRVPLAVVPLAPASDGGYLPFSFAIAMGLRRDDVGFRDQLNQIIRRRRGEIAAILRRYGVPLLPGEWPAPPPSAQPDD